jgi:hypothetical protein
MAPVLAPIAEVRRAEAQRYHARGRAGGQADRHSRATWLAARLTRAEPDDEPRWGDLAGIAIVAPVGV